jgi:hypothetical protein
MPQMSVYMHSFLHTFTVQRGNKLGHRSFANANTNVSITSPMCWSLVSFIRVWQLHQMNHFRANVQPSAAIRQLAVRPVIPDG